jgi:hypothetical protein
MGNKIEDVFWTLFLAFFAFLFVCFMKSVFEYEINVEHKRGLSVSMYNDDDDDDDDDENYALKLLL